MQLGDVVLFVPRISQLSAYDSPKYRWTVGRVYKVVGKYVQVVDIGGITHTEYTDKVIWLKTTMD